MSVNVVREIIKLDRMVGMENVQAMVEVDAVVPDSKPDISEVLSVEGKINILDKEIIQGKIVIDGVVNFNILYTGANSQMPVHNMKALASFTQNIEIDEIDGGMEPEIDYTIEYIDYNIANERKISLKAVLNLTGKTFKTEDISILKKIEGLDNIQVLKENLKYDRKIGSNLAQTVLRETFELAEETPEIAEVLETKGIAVVNEVRVTDGKVIVGGNIKLTMLYLTEEPRNPVQEIKQEIPFNHFVEVPKALSDMECMANVIVDEVFVEVKKNIEEKNKVYHLEVVLKTDAKVYYKDEEEVILDAYCPSRSIKIEKNNIKFLRNIGRNSSHTVVKEILDIPENYPNVFKIFTVKAKPMITDYKLVDEKNIVEGFINVDVLYIADTEDMEIRAFSTEVPFRHYVEIPGVNGNMMASAGLSIENVDFSSINSKQVEVKFDLNIYSEASEECEVEVITNIEDLGEEVVENNNASITVYFVQEGDNLWNIAKRYNTTIKEILHANDISDGDSVKPGDKIIIQKTYEYKM
ncbi:DUF3794 and LysM peptidoglycan-binding domain-containing protein [Caminicella sporogenes]|uniref:DUF3794 and LysM peptidoglycan-binding domain-containing protein n=1 Tax=Caminicella sporogenes TaxID=166485 RepID=UPI00253F6572|nr:SPOCS domain-containing protein [Caminicella sporogenes]WIF96001.1 DUF3794 domain-containing protein [Caminicella sporogenes]